MYVYIFKQEYEGFFNYDNKDPPNKVPKRYSTLWTGIVMDDACIFDG